MTITNKNYKRSQKGRSMVEMLGVLAIVGTLSVGGVYGYGVAMKKHKANELLHRASMLASTVSAQIMTGKNPTALDSFANSDLGTFSLETYTDGDNTFKLKISDIDGNVCEQMKSSMGGMVRNIVCDENAKTALMTFNKDLSTTDLPKTESVIDKNITNPEDYQKAGKTWCVETSSGNGQCSNSTDCCRGVTPPQCKDCTVVEGGYAFTSALPWAECDSDGDGTNDGQCIVDESTMIYTCQQFSCQETESCCKLYDVDKLDQLFALMDPLGMSFETVVEHLHKVQCSSCDPENGQTEPFPDGVGCQFFDLGTMSDADGTCVNGSCVAFDPDAFYKSCTSYTNCDSGEYCQFFEETIPTDPKPEKGYCFPLSEWKVESKFQKFTSYDSEGRYLASANWWTALDICSAMGKRLATWEEFGCDVNSTLCVGLAETWYETDGTWAFSYVYKSASDQTGGFLSNNASSGSNLFSFEQDGERVGGVICTDK